MVHRLIKPALLLGFLLVGNAAHAQGSTGRQGMLTCRTAPSLGLIIGSTQKLACQYRDNSGWTQDYFGRINRIGLDIGFTAGGVMAWGVIGSTGAVRPGVLTGRFVGAKTEERCMTEMMIRGPLHEPHLRDERRTHPLHLRHLLWRHACTPS